MSTPVFTRVRRCTDYISRQISRQIPTRSFARVGLGATLVYAIVASADFASAEWKVDLSRRASSVRETELHAAGQDPERRGLASVRADEGAGDGSAVKGLFDQFFDVAEPMQEIVILHTEKGFVPGTLRVRKGGRYTIHVVNVNEKEKNVSFILDGFSEHHATYYGKVKSFRLEPKKEGVYSFQSPETSNEGRLVVFSPQLEIPTARGPASEEMAK